MNYMSTIDEFTIKPAGELAPDFSLKDQHGESVSLRKLLSEGMALLYFYSSDGAPGVSSEVQELNDYRDKFGEFDISIAAISNDDQETHQSFAEDRSLTIRLLADPDYSVAKAYGVYNESGVNSRVTFIVAQDGEIVRVFPSQRMRSHIMEVYENVRETLIE